MIKNYNIEKEGQIDFFDQFQIDYKNESVLIDNTDGIWKGNILEFKLNISDPNKVLFQAIKYLSKMRIKGESVPANILCISLNTTICYVYKSQDYFDDIHKVYFGSSSISNEGFFITKTLDKIDYSTIEGAIKLKQYLNETNYMKIILDENCIVGWGERFYKENPKASKGDFIGDETGLVNIIGEIREPKVFKDFILPYKGKTNEKFKYLMDKLNDKLHKKDLGAFYTPETYCKKAIELVRKAISKVPKGNDYIILDRCAGTGNLEAFLSDDELSHCVLSTLEYYEYKVLLERLGDKVRAIIPPIEALVEYRSGMVANADAMSKEFIENEFIKKYLNNKKCSIILYENPPYNDTSSITSVYDEKGDKHLTENKNSFIFNEMSKEKNKFRNSNTSTIREYSNRFIWSGFKYYLRQEGDSYIVFSPVKYFKSLGIIENDDYRFEEGFLFNRKYFHASPSAISCVLWNYKAKKTKKTYILPAYDIDNNNNLEYIKDIEIKKIYKTFNNYQEKFVGKSEVTVCCDASGKEAYGKKLETKSYDDKEIIGYFCLVSASFNLGRLTYFNGRGFYLTDKNYINKLPLFCAKVFPEDNWYEKDVFFNCADKGDEYTKDQELLKSSLIFTALSPQNHICSIEASNGKIYKNELCFEKGTKAEKYLKNHFKLNNSDVELINLYYKILEKAKKTNNYNKKFTYGIYQIDKDLNTFVKDENTGKNLYDYPELNGDLNTLKSKLKEYYKKTILNKLFFYELLK